MSVAARMTPAVTEVRGWLRAVRYALVAVSQAASPAARSRCGTWYFSDTSFRRLGTSTSLIGIRLLSVKSSNRCAGLQARGAAGRLRAPAQCPVHDAGY